MKQFIGEIFAENMREWIPIPRCRAGEKIFHYTDLGALKGIVTDQSFWVTKSDFLNDKDEFRYAYKVIKKVCEELIPNEKNRHMVTKELKQLLGTVNNVMDGELLSGWYVLSFSREKDSLLLWTEFAKSQGYCLEFDYACLTEGVGGGIMLDGTVIYDKKEQIRLIKHTLQQLLQQNEERQKLGKILFSQKELTDNKEFYSFIVEFAVCSFVYSMFFKKECFKEEKEYRFVFWAFHEKTGTREFPVVTPMHFREKGRR